MRTTKKAVLSDFRARKAGPARLRFGRANVRRAPLLALVALSLVLFSCADKVETDYDRNVDFSQFRTYSWGQVKTDNPLNGDRIRSAIDKQLQAKGWQLTPSGGDITVFFTDRVQNQQYLETTYNNFGPGWGHGWGWGGWGHHGAFTGFGTSTTTVRNSQFGSLVIDLFQTSDKKLVWRGVISGTLSDKAEHNVQDLNNGIDRAFRNFPSKRNS